MSKFSIASGWFFWSKNARINSENRIIKYAEQNKIEGRCNNKEVSCKNEQEDGLTYGCITKEEYDTLVRISHYTEDVLNLLVEDENCAPHHLIIAKSPNSKGKGGLIVTSVLDKG